MKLFLFQLLSLNVKLLRCSYLYLCLSVDESRGTVKNLFSLHTDIVTYFEIIEYLVSYVSHFKGLTPRFSKIYISWKSNDPTGSYHIFSIIVVKMTNFDPGTRNCQVIHQIEANEPRIITKLILTETFYPQSKYIEKLKFWKFWPMTSWYPFPTENSQKAQTRS